MLRLAHFYITKTRLEDEEILPSSRAKGKRRHKINIFRISVFKYDVDEALIRLFECSSDFEKDGIHPKIKINLYTTK